MMITSPARILTHDDLRTMVPSAFAIAPWEMMSRRYKMVPTIEVVEMLAEKGFAPVLAKQSRTRIEGKGEFTKHLIRFRHADYRNHSLLGQELPELVMTNSHDGTSAYKFMSGIFRIVCQNGLTVQSANFGDVSVKHSGGSDFYNRVVDATYEVLEDAPKTLASIETWKQIQLSPPQAEAFAAAALEIRDSTTEVKPSQILRPKRWEDKKADVWTTANVIQENLMKGGIRGASKTTGKNMSTREIKSVNEDLRLNRALWTLTERLAQIAGA